MKYILSIFMAFALVVTGFLSHTEKVFAESGSDDNGIEAGVSVEVSSENKYDDKGGSRFRGDKDRQMEFKKEREDWKNVLDTAKTDFSLRGKEIRTQIGGVKTEFEKKREMLKAEFEKKSEEFKNRKEEIKKEMKDKLGEVRGNIFVRFEIAVERIGQIQDKLALRIDTLSNEGKDMTSAKSHLDSSKSHLLKAKELIAQAKVKAEADVVSVSATATITSDGNNSINQALRDEIRALLKNAKEELVLAHKDLREAFKSIIHTIKPQSDDSDDDSKKDSSGDDATGSNQ